MKITLNADSCEEYPTPTSSESYSLNVNHDGIYLTGSSVWGVLHGLETFYQLVYGGKDGSLFIKEIDIIGKSTTKSQLKAHNSQITLASNTEVY